MPSLRYPSKTERKIVKMLIQIKRPITAYEITKKYYETDDLLIIISRENFIRKVLQDLTKRGILASINSRPIFYEISKIMKGRKYESILYEVECPKCKKIHWIMDGAKTKQCSCLNNNGVSLRFWITPQRYTGKKKII